jgi:hypothetical protein
MHRMRWPLRVVTLLALLALLVITAGPANAQTGTIDVGPTAKLVAHGAAVDVPLTVSLTCEEGFTSGLVEVAIAQAQGQRLVFGGPAQVQFTPCDGTTQAVTVRIFAGAPFRGGPAVVNASLLQCFGEGQNLSCEGVGISTSEEIKIRGG